MGGQGGRPPRWDSRWAIIRAKKGGILGQNSLFIILKWVIRASSSTDAPLANSSKYVYGLSLEVSRNPVKSSLVIIQLTSMDNIK